LIDGSAAELSSLYRVVVVFLFLFLFVCMQEAQWGFGALLFLYNVLSQRRRLQELEEK
jgi:hypothetical protein